MRISIVGAVRAEDESGAPISLGGSKQRAVLAVLAANVGEFVSADRISEAVWGDAVPSRAARSVATYVSNLRRQLGCDIESRQGSYCLFLPRRSVDLAAFLDALEAVEGAEALERVDLLREALALCSGVPFAGIEEHGVLRDVAIEYGERRLAAEKVVLEAEAGDGSASVLSRLGALVHEHPYDEELRSIHIRALYAAGRHVDALSSFRTYETSLREELGLEPSAQLRDLELQVLEHSLGPDPASGSAVAPSLADPTPVPRRYTAFMGRDAELGELKTRMAEHRLVSLVGAGGIGKSTLAAEAVRDAPAGVQVAWISVETVSSDAIALAVAHGVGLQPAGTVDPIDALVRYLETRPHLLVFDGCEASVAEVSRVARTVLERSDARILATSRESLGLVGESVMRVDPLTMDDAAALFMSHAELPSDLEAAASAAVRSVCAALDGMPLAVELAASRARSLPLDRIAERAKALVPLLARRRSFDERHGSLLAALDWSFDLLTPNEQETLQAVSVFRAPFSIDDVVSLVDRADAEDDLARLVDTSLVQFGEESGSYGLLEPIRQYASHQLQTADRTTPVHNRHAELLASGAEHAARREWTAETLDAWDWIFDKRADLYAATVWSADQGDGTAAIRICSALGRRLVAFGVHPQFAAPLERAVDGNKGRDDPILAQAMVQLGWMKWRDGRPQEGLAMVDDALAMARRLGDPRAGAEALYRHATIAYSDREAERAITEMDEAAGLLEQLGDPPKTMQHLNNQAVLLLASGRVHEAEELANTLRNFSTTTLGIENFAPPATIAGVREGEGRLEEALDLTVEAAEIAERQRQYFHAKGYWNGVADLADRLGTPQLVAHAVQRVGEIDLLTGARSPQADMLAASIRGGAADILGAAFQWASAVRDRFIDRPMYPGLAEDTIHGTKVHPPAIFTILVHVARALTQEGRTEDACRLATSVPSLMKTSRYARWEQRREAERWESLLAMCEEPDRHDWRPLQLEDLFDYVLERTRPYANHSDTSKLPTNITPR